MIRDLFNEAIKTHPDIKAMLKIFKANGYKAKVQYGQLNIPFPKGVSEADAEQKFLDITHQWTWNDKKSGDISYSYGTFSGKVFFGVIKA
jgi:hypothetical protein